ncbi:MAG TPA: 3-oxoacyl-ACP reductase FabG [Vicinamibacterales bacterium]|nr:3-oxoacyl-ACP reductase FabG [Vicinamibacterales bacterium]
MLDFGGKVAIVTGASRGIGRGIAEMLATRGAHVVAGARGENAQGTVDAIRAAGGRAEVVSLDVTDPASVDAMVAGVLNRHGRVDVLVNNAGITRDQLMLRMKREEWDEVVATNLTSAFTCVQAVLKTMIRQRSGRIISISSVVGQMGNAGQANYAASKAGLIGFSLALAREVASRNITVNVVTPGMVDTDMTRAVADKAQHDWETLIPLKRLGTPADVAAAVCFLASDEASYITGQVLAVNGGMYM